MQADDEKVYNALTADLAKNFDFDTSKAVLDVENFLSPLQEKLSEQIFYLLQNDYNRLLAILYRIDVDEKKVSECLGGADIFTAADNLAKAVIERQIKKVRYRMGNY